MFLWFLQIPFISCEAKQMPKKSELQKKILYN